MKEICEHFHLRSFLDFRLGVLAVNFGWTADQLAMQVMVWQMVRDGAVRGIPLAQEFERNARFAPTGGGQPLVILACLARAAAGPEIVGERYSAD